MMSADATDSTGFGNSVTVHIGDIDPLLDWAEHASQGATVVLAPVELHRRNLKLRLTETNRPLDAFAFTGPVPVASTVLATVGKSSDALDYVDRLAFLEEILDAEHEATERFRMVLGGEPAQCGTAIEQARRDLEVTTNYHPVRVRAFRKAVDVAPSPVDVDTRDVLAGTLAVERALRRRSEKSPSDGSLIRRATRALTTTDGSAWTKAYPAVDRVALVGLSTIPATLVDLLTGLSAACDVEVHLFLRRGTGPFLTDRFGDVCTVSNPGRVVVT